MELNSLLESELLRLRLRLQDESKSQVKPKVCSDEDIRNIALRKPQTEEELKKICNLDYRYVPSFLSLLKSICQNENYLETMPSSVEKTLRELEKKLVDINKRNRMLYFPKLTVTSFDLCKSGNDPFDLLFRKKVFKITNANPEAYQLFNKVYRDTNKNYREKGILDLYVGYPFIKGKIAEDDFYIHAPLCLFPIAIEKGIDYVKIKLDTSKEVVYNSHLLLANYKFNDVNKQLPEVSLEKLNLATFIEDLISFYANEGIRFYANHQELTRFREVRADDLKYHKAGDFTLEGYAVLARFSSYSTILQKDFELMLKNRVINPNLRMLLDTSEVSRADTKTNIQEEELSYVGELNSSQEEVISKIRRNEAVVVEGPPGTGKSQTITSLITNFILDNKNILLVSEKKAALDVVYSRLGPLNKYAMQIDDINDKTTFYTALDEMFSQETSNNIDEVDLNSVNQKIEYYMHKFKQIDETFYQKGDFEVPFYKVYLETKNYNMNKPQQKQEYNAFNTYIGDFDFVDFTYSDYKKAFNHFNSNGVLEKVLIYKKYEDTWFFYVKSDLTSLDLVDIHHKITELQGKINQYSSSSGFKRSLGFGSLKKEINEFLATYCNDYPRHLKKDILENNLNPQVLDDYNSLKAAKPIFNNLTMKEIRYLDALIVTIKQIEHHYDKANQKLLNFLLVKAIETYEAKHSEVLADIQNYEVILTTLDSLFKDKKAKVSRKVANILAQNIQTNIKDSPKWAEINHNIKSEKRKYNITRFMSRYAEELNNGIRIWLLTPEVVSEVFPIFRQMFDLVIFDEASQLYIEKSIPAIFRAKKLVVAGDSKQLRPSSLGSGRLEYDFDEYDEDNIALEEESLLELAKYKILPPTILNFHYRSKYQELIAFSNYAFYDENLYIAPNKSVKDLAPIQVYKVKGRWINRSNKEEALKIVSLLKDFLKNRSNKETIGIITFNSQQRDLIEDTIDELALQDSEFASLVKEEYSRKENGEDIGLFVKNIENVQGDERDAIFFSIGYALNENGKLIHNFGWLNQKGGENRLNVAITRARKHITVVCSIDPTDLKVEQTSNAGPRYLRKYLEYCFDVSNHNFKAAKQTLYSLQGEFSKAKIEDEIIKEVYQEIARHGFQVEANVGIGAYSIDIAVKQDNKYLLGIEFDAKLFKNAYSYRERDYFRYKYLEARGWSVYRIWSMNWQKNKNAVIGKIMEKLYAICRDNEYLIEE